MTPGTNQADDVCVTISPVIQVGDLTARAVQRLDGVTELRVLRSNVEAGDEQHVFSVAVDSSAE